MNDLETIFLNSSIGNGVRDAIATCFHKRQSPLIVGILCVWFLAQLRLSPLLKKNESKTKWAALSNQSKEFSQKCHDTSLHQKLVKINYGATGESNRHQTSWMRNDNSTTSFNRSCKVLIDNPWDYHFEVVESALLRYPLPWNKFKCNLQLPARFDLLLKSEEAGGMNNETSGYKRYY